MPCTEAYREHIMYTFNGYCKTVIRFAAINAWRDRSRRGKKKGIKHSGKSGKCTDHCGVRPGYQIRRTLQLLQQRNGGCFYIGNPSLLPYETVVRATSGEPEAVDEVLRHYGKRIRIAAIEKRHIDRDTRTA